MTTNYHSERPTDAAYRIAREVTASSEYGVADLYGRARYRELVALRHRWWRELHRAGFGLAHIARLCNVHHTSVLYATKKIDTGESK